MWEMKEEFPPKNLQVIFKVCDYLHVRSIVIKT